MTDVPPLIAQGRAVLAAFTESPTHDSALAVGVWAGTHLAALLNALDQAQLTFDRVCDELGCTRDQLDLWFARGVVAERDRLARLLEAEREPVGYAVVVAHQEPGWPPVVDDTNTSLEYAEDARRRLTRQHNRAYRVCELREVES